MRLPNPVWSGQLRRLAWQAAVVFLLAIVFGMFSPNPPTAVFNGTWLGVLLAVLSAVTMLVALGYAVVLMRHWWMFRKSFSNIVAGAEAAEPT